jgi:hypothetical protein
VNLRYSPAVTTPPTPAGWYPDPDGSGGQRYWDGFAWIEHRSPGAHEPSEPTVAAEPPASEEPTAVVSTRPAGEHVGAHRAPEPEPEPEPTPEPVPTPEPEPGPTAVIDLGSNVPSEQLTTPVMPSTSRDEPSFGSAPLGPPPSGEPPARDDRRQLMIWFGAACAALLAVLVLVVIYGVFINKPETTGVSAAPTSTSKSSSATTSSKSTETPTESPTSIPSAGAVTDGNFSFEVTGVETAPSVKYGAAPVEKTAQGEFLIVHMTVTNTGAMSATFLGTLQKLKAGGATYSIDDEATFYLDGGVADTNPGDTKDVAIAFDVPPGTTPDSIELHGDPISSGVEVPLS